MQIKLMVDADRLTVDDIIDLEGAKTPVRIWRDRLARFMVDENDVFIPEDEARLMIGQLSINEVRQVIRMFWQKVKELQVSEVPPESGGE